MQNQHQYIKCLELFAGIGGFHCALKAAIDRDVDVTAFDINTTTNEIYKHNFPNTELKQCNIQALSARDYDEYNADLWTMSPPCQPFTRKGLQKDVEDRRCDALKSICSALLEMKRHPRYIILENVCGFETSEAHKMLIKSLLTANYHIEEFILSPEALGIPNSRPRFYLLAKLGVSNKSSGVSSISTAFPSKIAAKTKKIGDYLCKDLSNDSLYIERITLERYANVMNLVTRNSMRSACFTKSYHSFVAGTGPVLVTFSDDQVENVSLNELRSLIAANVNSEHQIKARLLSWREMANLLGFPGWFSKPPMIIEKQMCRALGNSLSVDVVAILLAHLISNDKL